MEHSPVLPFSAKGDQAESQRSANRRRVTTSKKNGMPASAGKTAVLRKSRNGLVAAETSVPSSFPNEAPCGMGTRINDLIRTAHEVSGTPVTYRPLSDPVFVTFHGAGWAVRRGGKSQAGARSPTSPIWVSNKHLSSGYSVERGLRRVKWEHGRRGNHVPRIGLPRDGERWDSVEKHQGRSGSHYSCLATDCATPW